VSHQRIPVTAIVLTHNEEANMRPCLSGLAQIDDVVLVDSGSRDATLDAARAIRPDVRIFDNPFEDFAQQRNWALDNAILKHDWVLFVDADEYSTPEFMDELERFVADPGDSVGAFIAGKNYFLGTWLKWSTLYPSHQLRLLKRGEVRFEKSGHGQSEVTDGSLAYMREGWRHEAFSKGISQWIARHNRYTSEEAAEFKRLRGQSIVLRDLLNGDPVKRRRALKRLGARLPLRPVWLFLYLYVVRLGFLDGYPGWLYCCLVFSNMVATDAKVREFASRAGGE